MSHPITLADQWRGCVWEPEAEPKGVVCLIHGLGEHCGRYQHWAARFNRAGYILAAVDLPGHGRSPGKRGHFPGYPAVFEVINALLDFCSDTYPTLPQFLYGHSMGGNMVLSHVLDQPRHFAGVIVTGPLIIPAVAVPAWKTAAARVLLKVMPSLGMANEIDTGLLARDPNIADAYVNDDLVHNITTPAILEVVDAGAGLPERAVGLKQRLLLIHGEKDAITDPNGSRAFAANAGKHCTLKIWPDLFHEVHNEPEKDAVFAFIREWMEADENI